LLKQFIYEGKCRENLGDFAKIGKVLSNGWNGKSHHLAFFGKVLGEGDFILLCNLGFCNF